MLSLRRDGSSKFGKDYKWGNFPGVSAGWRINNEDFLRWMFEFAGYQYTLKIDTGIADSEYFDKRYYEITESLNLKPMIIEDGWVTLACAEGIYAECKRNLA
mgnify:CR=1 FL=1